MLADESSTIKKVFQLSLQDYAVEIKTVNLGVDVLAVAQSSPPDIIFADVLLQKRNGYEVAKDIKSDPRLKSIPVVLMWSNFMEIDEDKFDACGAEASLEKPFDVSALRQLVQKLVPKTKTQKISQFLSFPSTVATPPPPLEKETQTRSQVRQEDKSWDMESFEPIESFAKSKAPAAPQNPPRKIAKTRRDETLRPESNPADELEWGPSLPLEGEEGTAQVLHNTDPQDSDWVRKDIGQFKVDLGTAVALEDDEPEVNFSEPEEEFEIEEPPKVSSRNEISISKQSREDVLTARGSHDEAFSTQLSREEIENIIRSQSAEVIESVVWKVVPELASQLIEKELKRLLKE